MEESGAHGPRTPVAAAASADVVIAASRTRSLRDIRRALVVLARDHTPIFAVLLAFMALAFAIDVGFTDHRLIRLRVYDHVFAVMLEAYAIIFLVGFSLREIRNVPNGRSLVLWMWRALRCKYLTVERLGGFVLMVVWARLLTDTFVSLKAAIPLIEPFSWDRQLMLWDRAVHGGHDPWRLLQQYVTPEITGGLSFLYNLWIFVLFGIFIWQAWSEGSQLRRRFFLTFGLAWALLGTSVATVMSSAGPCYYSRVTNAAEDPYAPLMSYLRTVNATHQVWALDVQEELWGSYVENQRGNFAALKNTAAPAQRWPEHVFEGTGREMLNGISAMPSMHVAMAVLFALVGWQTARWLGVLLTLYAVSIQIGAVHLGWHYAVDGYASAIAVIILWLIVGHYLSRSTATRRLAL